MYSFLKEVYILKLDMLIRKYKRRLKDNRVQLSKDNIKDYFIVEKSFISKKFKLKYNFIYINGWGYYFSNWDNNPLDDTFGTYCIDKSIYEDIKNDYENESREIIKDFRNEVYDAVNLTFEEAEELLKYKDFDWLWL